MDTLIDFERKTVIGEIVNPRFLVLDGSWVYKVFQDENRAEFEKEKDILHQLELGGCSHQCRMEAFGYATRRGKQYHCIKMPRYGKNNLENVLNKSSGFDLTEDKLIGLIEKMLAPFWELEKMGYRHNDIALDNLILKENGSVVLLDFGAAIRMADIDRGEIGVLELRGHTDYNAPEKQNGVILHNSDIFSFGKLLGKMVERGEHLGQKYSDQFLSMGIKCREHESENRFQSFQEVASALSRLKDCSEEKPRESIKMRPSAQSENKSVLPKRISTEGLKEKLTHIVVSLAIVSSLSFLSMEIYLTFFRTYGDTPLEVAATERRSISSDLRLTIYDITNHIKNNKQ